MNKEPVHRGGYFQPDRVEANFAFWTKMPQWSADEAASLLLGLNPFLMNDHRLLDDGPSQFEDKYHSLSELAWRALEHRNIEHPYTPARWLAWAKERDLPIPSELAAEIVKLNRVSGGHGTWVAQERNGAAPRQASKEDIRYEAQRIYADANKNGGTGPNKADATKEIRRALGKKDLNASWRLIDSILDEDEFKNQRGKRGKTHRSMRR